MDEDSKLFTAFQTPLGLMEFNFMPFGLCTAAPTFQKAMRKAVGHLPHVASYFDDILIHSASWEDHLLDLEATLQALRQHNLTGKPSKVFVD
ncbi:reverse transcriptase [Plakobranchus ocellatus]|uniref:Reverse transcriptase n=1 Tax=Plakobranchus ocellatus TaxID=259542 RepID=A0AAV4BXE5_9GAST|nr:reverse transcriptase [Plakobranchus ocellatus]